MNIVTLSVVFSQKQQLRFERLSVDDGLSQNTVTCIAQDKTGFLWIGTEDGLNRYDGYEFRVFKRNGKKRGTISDNYITTIYLDSKGTLWVGTARGGFNKYDEQTATFSHSQHNPAESNSLCNNTVNAILEDKNGNLWFATENGLDEYNPQTNTFTHYKHDSTNIKSLSSNRVNALVEDRNGVLWIGTYDGLNRFDKETNTFHHYRSPTESDKLHENVVFFGEIISSLLQDSRGELWVATVGGGFYRYDYTKDTFRRYGSDSDTDFRRYGLKDNFVHTMYEDHLGTFWVGTEHGLIQFDREQERGVLFTNSEIEPRSVSNNFIKTLFEDRSHNLWIGTEAGGINKLDRKAKKFSLVKSENKQTNELQSNNVLSFFVDSSKRLWVGTWLGGLHRFDASTQSFRNYTREKGVELSVLSSSIVYSIAQENEHTLWIGTAWGLNRFDTRKETSTKYLLDEIDFSSQDSFPPIEDYANNIYSILQLESKELLLGTNNGLYSFRYGANQWKRWRHDERVPNTLSSNFIYVVFRDSKKRFWIGTNGGGLNLFDKTNNTFTHFRYDSSDENSVNDDVINTIVESSSGILWLGTKSGLNEFLPEENKFIRYDESDGLPNNVVHCILEDRERNLWLSTNRGISKFNTQTKTFRNYVKEDGLQGNAFNNFAALKTPTGEMYFGGTNGYNVFFPDSIRDNDFIPPVVLTSFQKFNKETELEYDISFTNSITLNYDDNVFSFGFSSLDFTHPVKNIYAYQMVGVNDEWVVTKNNRVATYTHLDPGEYVFRVKATNSDGVWNETSTSVAMTIIPPFWGTWWFRFFVIIMFFSVGPLLYLFRVRKLKKEQERQREFSRQLIEHQETERKRVAAELHDGIAQNILVIKNLTFLGREASKGNIEATESFEEISSISINTIDELRKITHNLRPIHLDRLGLTETIRVLVKNIAKSSNMKIRFEVESLDNIFPKELEINLFRIVQECFNNILKHSEATEVNFISTFLPGKLFFLISDNGKGFKANIVQQNSTQTGFGLSGLHERAKILQGELHIHSEIGKGTEVTFTMPVNKNEKRNGELRK